MHEAASADQDILDQIDAAVRKIRRTTVEPAIDPDPERAAVSGGTRWLLTLFACLTAIYHADHAMAQVIEGETSDDHMFVSWEYDLESGMGLVQFRNIDVQLEDGDTSLYLAGLLPERVRDLGLHWSLSLDRCLGGGAPPDTVFGRRQPGQEAWVQFAFCDAQPNSGISLPPCSLIQPSTQEVRYGTVHQLSAACVFFPKGTLKEFVTVRPLDCGVSDRDKDGDVDLQDFANFQVNTPPEQLPCFDPFYDELTGPR